MLRQDANAQRREQIGFTCQHIFTRKGLTFHQRRIDISAQEGRETQLAYDALKDWEPYLHSKSNGPVFYHYTSI